MAPDGVHYAYAEYDPAPTARAGATAPSQTFAAFLDTSRGGDTLGLANGPVIGSAGRVHVVDARTGTDRVVYAGEPTFAAVDYSAAGLYLARFAASRAGTESSELYLLDPAGGMPRLLTGSDLQLDRGGWRAIDRGAAWGTRFTSGSAIWPGNQLMRFDLKTGAVAEWLTSPIENTLALLGFDSDGHPLMLTEKASSSFSEPIHAEVLLLTGPDRAFEVFATDNAQDPLPGAGAAAGGVFDVHGIWIGGLGGIWLYQAGTGRRRFELLAANSIVVVGGACA